MQFVGGGKQASDEHPGMPYTPFKKQGETSALKHAPDKTLIASCLQGDANAWDALISRYAALIYSVSLRLGASQADADDIFQDVCVILLNHLGNLRDTTRLSGWLISTTRREAWRVLRKRKGATLASDLGEGEWEMEGAEGLYAPEDDGNPESEIMMLEEEQLMRQALAQMPDRCRELITLLYVAENPLSYQELSEKLALPVGSIGPTRARCLQNLRKILQQLGY